MSWRSITPTIQYSLYIFSQGHGDKFHSHVCIGLQPPGSVLFGLIQICLVKFNIIKILLNFSRNSEQNKRRGSHCPAVSNCHHTRYLQIFGALIRGRQRPLQLTIANIPGKSCSSAPLCNYSLENYIRPFAIK